MNEGHVTSPPVPEAAARTTVPYPREAASPSRWTAGVIAALVIGTLLALVSLTLLGGGMTAVWADRTQRDDGYVTTDVHEFSSSGSAIATVSTDLGSAGTGWLYSPSLLDTVRIRVTPANAERALFVGIGPTDDVHHYLAGVSHTMISEFWEDETELVNGGNAAPAPGTQDFWVAAASGVGKQSVVWDPTDGSWTVVVMNADGSPGIDIGADLGAELPALPWVALGVVAAGAILLAGGALLIVGALRRSRARRPVAAGSA